MIMDDKAGVVGERRSEGERARCSIDCRRIVTDVRRKRRKVLKSGEAQRHGERDAEGGQWGGDIPLCSRIGGLGSVESSPAGTRAEPGRN